MGLDTSFIIIRSCCYVLASSSGDEYAAFDDGCGSVVSKEGSPPKLNWANKVIRDKASPLAYGPLQGGITQYNGCVCEGGSQVELAGQLRKGMLRSTGRREVEKDC